MTPDEIARLSVQELRRRLLDEPEPLSEAAAAALAADPRGSARAVHAATLSTSSTMAIVGLNAGSWFNQR